MHEIACKLGPRKSKALGFFHAFTGCDVTSFFAGKGKRSAWDAWRVCPAITDVFCDLASQPMHVSDEAMEEIERFVVVMYVRTRELSKVNVARQRMFSKGSRSIENIPPTADALYQHTLRATYQAGHVWATCLQKAPVIPSPADWGWTEVNGKWTPV